MALSGGPAQIASPKSSLHWSVDVQCWIVVTAHPQSVPPSGATQILHPSTHGGKSTPSMMQPVGPHDPPWLHVPPSQQCSPAPQLEMALQVWLDRHSPGVQASTGAHWVSAWQQPGIGLPAQLAVAVSQ
jgi:hypothetical protein